MPEKLYDKYFETRFPNYPYRDRMFRPIVEYVQRYVPKDSIILDLGAGYCNFINHITAKEKHAADISNIIEKYADKNVICHVKNCANLDDIPNEKFDVVFESNLLEHLETDALEKTIKEIYRILKPGGTFIGLQPNFQYAYRSYFDDYTHRQILSHYSFQDILENYGFKMEKIYKKFLPFSFKTKLPRIPFLVKVYLRSPWKPRAGQMLAIVRKPHV
ncbi:class I SAM-dependent methyltransferase [Candidatus Azambacteria bacterium]|nr:class I SAM-dependent methyltransferase [Candidatus Azambacteria bacterium]